MAQICDTIGIDTQSSVAIRPDHPNILFSKAPLFFYLEAKVLYNKHNCYSAFRIALFRLSPIQTVRGSMGSMNLMEHFPDLYMDYNLQ